MADLDLHFRAARIIADAGLIPVLRRALLAPRTAGPGLFGFVLFVIASSSADFYVFFVLSLALFAVHFPRRDRWEEWARQTPPRA